MSGVECKTKKDPDISFYSILGWRPTTSIQVNEMDDYTSIVVIPYSEERTW